MSIQSVGNHDKKGRLIQPTYNDGRTKQSFKDETDINKILSRAQKAGTLSHLQKYEGTYGDFADFDFFEAQIKMTRGREVFDALPSEIRMEFAQSPAAFFAYANDPENKDRLRELLPGLAMPGRQNLDVSGKTAPDDPPAEQGKTASEASEAEKKEPEKALEPAEGSNSSPST